MTIETVRESELTFTPATAEDAERLLELKVLVMRADLERLGRFTPERARARFLAGFDPTATRLVQLDGRFAGCISVHDRGDHTEIEHLYIRPEFQGIGLGGRIVREVLAEAGRTGRPVRITVLNGSRANAFYQRLGFVETGRDPIDIRYVWEP